MKMQLSQGIKENPEQKTLNASSQINKKTSMSIATSFTHIYREPQTWNSQRNDREIARLLDNLKQTPRKSKLVWRLLAWWWYLVFCYSLTKPRQTRKKKKTHNFSDCFSVFVRAWINGSRKQRCLNGTQIITLWIWKKVPWDSSFYLIALI